MVIINYLELKTIPNEAGSRRHIIYPGYYVHQDLEIITTVLKEALPGKMPPYLAANVYPFFRADYQPNVLLVPIQTHNLAPPCVTEAQKPVL